MNPLIKITTKKLEVKLGYVLIDRETGTVISEGTNQFELENIGRTYTAKTGKCADIRQKAVNDEVII